MSSKIFISHAVADAKIAAELNRLFATGLGVTGKDVFCSSLPGRTIPGGFNFVDHIKKNLESAKIVILLITENYMDSQFCLAEVGAAWISKQHVVPVVVPPFTRSKLKATLSITQAWRINDDDDLNGLADDIHTALGIDTAHAQWGAEKKEFLNKINVLIEKQIPPKNIDPNEFEKLTKENAYQAETIVKQRSELEAKDALISKIKKAKDADQIRDIELESSSEREGFEALYTTLSELVVALPRAARDAIYHSVRGEGLPKPEFGDSDSEDQWREIRIAQQKNMLDGDGPFGLNEDHPKIRKALNAVDKLKSFMSEHEDVLRPLIEEEYEVTYSLGDEDFWHKFI